MAIKSRGDSEVIILVPKEKIKNFPDKPGVYLMKDQQGHVIYVGKALSLRKRVRSYFLKFQPSIKTQIMLSYVRDIGHIETACEYDALILESNLIKQYKPRFNITLKDDKSFPYIKITREKFPRVFIGRRRKAEEDTGPSTKSLRIDPSTTLRVDYFGPYTSSKLLRRALKILRKSFPFCTCRRFPKKACLHYHLGLCAGPCQKKASKKAYLKIIKGLEDFLLKKDTELIDELSFKMRELVRCEKFEEAANVREQLEALSLFISLKKIDARKTFSLDEDLLKLGFKKEPLIVEAFDISNIGSNQTVGSMAYFYKGRPDKNNYRRFKIKTVAGIDDYAMIQEVVRRRYERLLLEKEKMPDLIIIDGGRGHLDAACVVLETLRLNIPMIAIAKRQELIYTISHRGPIKLAGDSKVLQLIQRARDEAHRFALKYHHLLRKKDAFEE